MFYFWRHDRNANLAEHVCVFGCNQQVDEQDENRVLKAELDKCKKEIRVLKAERDRIREVVNSPMQQSRE